MEKIDTSKLGPIKIDPNELALLHERAIKVSHMYRTPMDAIVGLLADHDKRVRQLIIGNSEQVIKRREATALLIKSRDQYLFYAREHRAKIKNFEETIKWREDNEMYLDENNETRRLLAATIAKAETNEAMAAEIQLFLDNIHIHGPSPMGKAS